MNWLRNFMIGRYGTDSLSLFLLVLSVIITFVSSIFGGNIITLLLSYGLWFWIIFRTLSRNIAARSKENQIFLNGWRRVMDHTTGFRGWVKTESNRVRDRKTHVYFRCPSCHQMVRVPRNKGKVRIICPKCKNEFIRSTGKSPAQKIKEEQQRAEKAARKAAKKAEKSGKH